jgi:hypothetical protein
MLASRRLLAQCVLQQRLQAPRQCASLASADAFVEASADDTELLRGHVDEVAAADPSLQARAVCSTARGDTR